jgi:putative restriction endonuclease
MADDSTDTRLRGAAMAFLNDLSVRNGGVATWQELQEFEFEGRRIPLVGQKGIRKVLGFDAALTILTTYRLRPQDRPYDDAIGSDGYPRYKWRGSDGTHPDNVALRAAMNQGKPVAWLEGVDRGVYLIHTSVWLVGEEPGQKQFVVALNNTMSEQWQPDMRMSEPDLVLRREYAEVVVRQRLHQPMFKRRVLTAYRTQCAMCRLRVRELLEAAHIKPDSEGGEPVVPNGIALCAIHHRAFDALVVGVTPDYLVQVRADVLQDHDGPTLQHALQEIHGTKLVLPARAAQRPDPELLEHRYEQFREAG